jgi:hypothetical protein
MLSYLYRRIASTSYQKLSVQFKTIPQPNTQRPQQRSKSDFVQRSINYNFIMSMVAISVCDLALQNRQLVDIIPFATLQHYAPEIIHLIDHDWNSDTHELLIRLQSFDHADDIEVVGLQLLLGHWRRGCSMTALIISHTMPIGTAVLIYRAFQLLQMDIAAETLRARLMRRMHTRPLSEIDIQNVWWAFKRDGDWRDWLGAIYKNITHFHLLERQRAGVYIQQFLYTELLQLTQEQRTYLPAVWDRHVAHARSVLGWRRFWYRVAGCLS